MALQKPNILVENEKKERAVSAAAKRDRKRKGSTIQIYSVFGTSRPEFYVHIAEEIVFSLEHV